MNVLLLTPDAVGGTLLQRLLTVYMQFHSFDRPVIGLSDLSLGVDKFYSPHFNREILKTSSDNYQTLSEIKQIIDSVDHYKIAKLTHYISRRRKDGKDQLVPFYNYLNDNFFIIACRRDNIFEHAMSWGISKVTNRLNVYSSEEKAHTFVKLYQEGITIDPVSLTSSLDSYRDFIQWCEDNFSVASYYSYEKNLPNIESYILGLPIFNGQKKIAWNDVFDLSFDEWNRYHFLKGDIGGLALEHSAHFKQISMSSEDAPINDAMLLEDTKQALAEFIRSYNEIAAESWPSISSVDDYYQLPKRIQVECEKIHKITYFLKQIDFNSNIAHAVHTRPRVTTENMKPNMELSTILFDQHREFLSQHQTGYAKASTAIEQMQNLGILSRHLPVKKQTLAEKALMVKNFAECIDVYNRWAEKNHKIAGTVDAHTLLAQALREREYWTGKTNNQIGLLL